MATSSSKGLHLKHHHHQQQQRTTSSSFSPKLSIYILAVCVTLFVTFHIQSLETLNPDSSSDSSSSLPSWSLNLMRQWQRAINTTTAAAAAEDVTDSSELIISALKDKLRQSVTFLPLKDLRYAQSAHVGHTWFMSSMYDSTDEPGEVQYQRFPSNSSNGRLLCLKGRDNHDGSWNSYALAWPDALPYNATLMPRLTFVSYNHYNYHNIWHGLSAIMPFVAWHKKNYYAAPDRWVLYHWGEIRSEMGLWPSTLVEATFGAPPYVEMFDGVEEGRAVCFEDAVVMRHNEGGMSRDQRMGVYDLIRCKARAYCNVSEIVGRRKMIGMTLLMRTGLRSFKNESAVVGIFQKECAKVDGCRLMVAHSNNVSFCDQVRLMSMTDILISPHGAQLTNLFFMDRNGSVMEFFPKGWLKLAGVGQFVFHWMASWSGMRHHGAWRDPDGELCQYGEDDRRCMSLYKNGKIGFNETYFSEWSRNTINEVKKMKKEEASKDSVSSSKNCVSI